MSWWLLLLLLGLAERPMLVWQRSKGVHAATSPRRAWGAAAGAAATTPPAHARRVRTSKAGIACSSRQEVAQAVLDAVARPPVSAVCQPTSICCCPTALQLQPTFVQASKLHYHFYAGITQSLQRQVASAAACKSTQQRCSQHYA